MTEKGFGVLESRLNFLEDAVKASHFFVEGGLHAINANLDTLSKNSSIASAGNANNNAAGSVVMSDAKKVTGASEGGAKSADTGKSISKNDARLAALKEFKQKQKNVKLQKGLFVVACVYVHLYVLHFVILYMKKE